MKHVQMKWEHGEEATCVVCGRRNAMLHVGHLGPVQLYECRDCHAQVAHIKYPGGEGEDAILLGRTLGKTCRECGGFCDQHGRRQDFSDGAQEKLGYWCNDCGTYWGN